MSNHDNEEIVRSVLAEAPIQLLVDTADRKGTLFVYLWLFHCTGLSGNGSSPSTAELANYCHMKEQDVRLAKRWLIDQGWIRCIPRPGQTDLFFICIEKTICTEKNA